MIPALVNATDLRRQCIPIFSLHTEIDHIRSMIVFSSSGKRCLFSGWTKRFDLNEDGCGFQVDFGRELNLTIFIWTSNK